MRFDNACELKGEMTSIASVCVPVGMSVLISDGSACEPALSSHDSNDASCVSSCAETAASIEESTNQGRTAEMKDLKACSDSAALMSAVARGHDWASWVLA